MSSFLEPIDAVGVGDATIVPDATRPVAAVVTGDDVRWVTWPDAPLPDGAVDEVGVLATDGGAWVVYLSREDAEGDLDTESRTAVHVTPTGVTCTVDLGDRRVLGADVDGLWIGDPRDASMWAGEDEDEDPEDDASADDLDEDSADPFDGVDPETLPWAPSEPFWPSPEEWAATLAAGEEQEDDDPELLDDDDDDGPRYWSVSFGGVEGGFVPPPEPQAEPAPPLPTPPTELVLVRNDGSRTTIAVDHLVEDVRRTGSVLTIRYAPTGPRRDPDASVFRSIVYVSREVDLDVSGGLPVTVTTDDLPSRAASDEDETSWEDEQERLEAALAPWTERFDLTDVEGAHWPLHDLDAAARERAVADLVAVFEALDQPGILWTRDHPEPRRSASDYRAVDATIEGEWPATELVVSFEHRAVPYLRLRRRYRVFDDAGHVEDWTYVTVHLEEEIATGHIADRSDAVDGVLDI
ncbi:hypothetical protein [Curtobacterium poinsettiae]|uniref:Uncharacterized protein n=1 Tax=Curtobacterium poinsettiae TaxID=159612 RepID=A0ABT3S0K7_9MICO|nr:hypothetical protein [Curtobacterium flaccumfaciens]MBT1608718.1 hypothetical protein [Curtobacterium flaccumfaciens pv. poinsettiae]MCX2848365.1 hypothetical protein [Curtobacterium flaccumfaciens pv. poinsettiae]UXN18957.1 hypothetical protein N8D78_02245 [Curtobacterium flaccumfaciens pv. poinsettiae]